MIYAICGTPGSYKSCYAVEKFVIPALKNHRQVFTNIEGLDSNYIATYFDLDPLDVENDLHRLGVVYDDDGTEHEDVERIRRFYEDLPQNALVVLDEAQNYYSSRDFKMGFSADLIPWLTKHRHLGNDVVWITQVMDSVDITFRRNTHLTYALKRMENIGFKNSSFVYIFDRADTERRHLSRKMYSPNPLIFKCYSSYQNDKVIEKRQSYNVLLRSPFMWIALFILAFAIYTIVSGRLSRAVFGKKEVPAVKRKVERVEAPKEPPKELDSGYPVKDVNLCIKKKVRVHGKTWFYLSDGVRTDHASGLSDCE